MHWSRQIGPILALGAAACLAAPPAGAKDVKGKWFAGGTLAYHTTQDAVENNASLGNDPRPDDFVSRELTLDDTVQAGLQVGFGLTGSLTLQLETGYYQGNVGSVDVYRTERYPGSNVGDPFNLTTVITREFSEPFTAGEMTQIPVMLTGLMRFRKDSALNPFVGAGVGKVFMEFQPGEDLYAVNRTIDSLRVKRMFNEQGTNLTPQFYEDRFVDDGVQPALSTFSLSYDLEDSWEWHLSVGMEYALSDRVGLVGEVRYLYYQSAFSLTLGGNPLTIGTPLIVSLGKTGPEDQVTFDYWPAELFHPDGSVRMFNNNPMGVAPNPRIPGDLDGKRFVCTPVGGEGEYGPGQIVDIDGNGQLDACYSNTLGTPQGQMIVQGGEIDLSGYSVQVGLRWYF
ncbi:MAG: outer membrane beta-barrel protein [Candidatus Polarisedimenticolia bacterium]